jgi:hypothetical protein
MLAPVGLCLVTAACSGGGAPAPGRSGGGRPGAGGAAAVSSTSSPSSGGGFTLATLAGLRNYTFTYSATGGIDLTGRVHDPTDWETSDSVGAAPAVTTYDVGGQGYSTVAGFASVQHVSLSTPEGYTTLNGEHTWAEAFIGFTHVTGIRVTAAGSCDVAGQSGTTYDFATPSADAGTFSIADQACVARSSGALLSFAEGVTGGSAASTAGLSGRSEDFAVTSVGGVGPIAAPSGAPAS